MKKATSEGTAVWCVVVESLFDRDSCDGTVSSVWLFANEEDAFHAAKEHAEGLTRSTEDTKLWWDEDEGATTVRFFETTVG